MSPSSRLLTRTFLVGVLVVSTAYGASALTVKRTNKLIDGVFVPVLIVESNGETYIHRVGEDGLTRSIMFNEKKALRWARAKYGADVVSVAGNGGDGGDGRDTGSGSGSGGSSGDDDDDDDDDGGGSF